MTDISTEVMKQQYKHKFLYFVINFICEAGIEL